MKIITFKYILITLLFVGTLSACSLMEVDNPNITDKKFLGTPQSAAIWLNGMKKQLSSTLNQTVVFTEMVSDNYFNNSSLSNQVFDNPTLLAIDLDIDQMQRQISRLREMATYGINEVVPAATEETTEILAEMYFLGAYAYILSGELHDFFPMEEAGEVFPAAAHFSKAAEYLQKSLDLDTDPHRRAAYTLALARTHYHLGDTDQAVSAANAAILADAMLLYSARFDGLSGASNQMQSYTFSSSTNTLAPLPRLDFLDPKYFHVGNISGDQKSIALLKIEEAHLILAEAALGNNDVTAAKAYLTDLIEQVISKRPTATVDARHAVRRGTRADYPLSGTVAVKADEHAVPMVGLVLPRTEMDITVHQISGTSVSPADLAQANSNDEVLYLLSLIRQEVFMSEGRRMTDLGIRFPVSNIESQNNPNVQPQHLQATIPAYIPAARGMDDFEYNEQQELVTIKHDMNKIIVANKLQNNVLPLIKN